MHVSLSARVLSLPHSVKTSRLDEMSAPISQWCELFGLNHFQKLTADLIQPNYLNHFTLTRWINAKCQVRIFMAEGKNDSKEFTAE